jgi:hypothetical protein
MSDPRNVAHDKKVIQEKKHHHELPAVGKGKAVQPGKKHEAQHAHKHEDPATERAQAAAQEPAAVERVDETNSEKKSE